MNKSQLMVGLTPEQQSTAKLVANNTLKYMDGDTEVYRHFNTDILHFEPDGTIVFNTDGHKSATTKSRLNTLQPFVSIWSEKRVWYASVRSTLAFNHSQRFVYADGMTFHPDRGIENAGTEPDKKLLKSMRKFAKDFAKSLPIEMPGPGDCFICACSSNSTNTEHLLSHIEEDYFVPRLLWNVLKESRRGEYIFAAAFKGNHRTDYYEQLLNSYRNQYSKDIYNYLYRRIVDGEVSTRQTSNGFCNH